VLEIDPRSDLFSFGALLYECLSGQPPPLRSYELWAHHFDADFESGVQRAMRAIPEPWRRVIERAMAQLPRDRYADARAMREALAALEEPAPRPVRSSASPRAPAQALNRALPPAGAPRTTGACPRAAAPPRSRSRPRRLRAPGAARPPWRSDSAATAARAAPQDRARAPSGRSRAPR